MPTQRNMGQLPFQGFKKKTMTAGHKIEAMTARRPQPVIFEIIPACRPPFSIRLPVNLGSMKIARAIAIITRISFMSDYRSNFKMGSKRTL